MPKVATSKSDLTLKWIKELEVVDQFNPDGSKLFCKMFSFDQRSQIVQHISTALHKNGLLRFQARPEVQLLLKDAVPERKNPFFMDLCKALVSADIPFHKLENPKFRNFLETHCKHDIPHRTTLAKNYLPEVYKEAIEEIRNDVGNHPVWFAVDETTDTAGRYIANVLVGALNKEEASKTHLLASKELTKTNHSTIVQLLLDSFQLLWPGSKQQEVESKFLLLLTDGVNYMLKAGKVLKTLYPSLLHVTCLAHGLNRVAEEVRSRFPKVDSLIASLKSVFRKAPSRVSRFKEICPELELPPEPVITRWGTWLDAVNYYASKVRSGNFGFRRSSVH